MKTYTREDIYQEKPEESQDITHILEYWDDERRITKAFYSEEAYYEFLKTIDRSNYQTLHNGIWYHSCKENAINHVNHILSHTSGVFEQEKYGWKVTFH